MSAGRLIARIFGVLLGLLVVAAIALYAMLEAAFPNSGPVVLTATQQAQLASNKDFLDRAQKYFVDNKSDFTGFIGAGAGSDAVIDCGSSLVDNCLSATACATPIKDVCDAVPGKDPVAQGRRICAEMIAASQALGTSYEYLPESKKVQTLTEKSVNHCLARLDDPAAAGEFTLVGETKNASGEKVPVIYSMYGHGLYDLVMATRYDSKKITLPSSTN